MKKILLILFNTLILSFFMFIGLSSDCYAASLENVPDTILDVLGRDDDVDYSNTPYDFYFLRDEFHNDGTYYQGYKGTVSVPENGRLCWIFDDTRDIEHHYRLMAFSSEIETAENLKSNIKGEKVVINYGNKWVFDNGKLLDNAEDRTYSLGSDDWFQCVYNNSSHSWLCFNTDIPIFDINDPNFVYNLNNYILTGEFENALNSDFINEAQRTPNSNVEMPLGLKVTSGIATKFEPAYSIDEDFSCHWSQTVDTSSYKYEYQFRVTLEAVKTPGRTDFTGKEFNSGWVKFGEAMYNSNDSITLSVSSKSLDKLVTDVVISTQGTEHPLNYKQYLVTKIEFRVRNVDCSSDDNYCSNWVIFKATKGGSSLMGDNPDAEDRNSLRTEDSDGVVTTDEENNPYGVDYDPVDRDNLSPGSSARQSIAYFLDLISSGFGFTGNHGLLSLFSAWFSWLPSQFITIVMVGFGLIVFVSVIRIMLDILT